MEKDYLNSKRILKARAFAMKAHEGQIRKTNGRAKIEHPFSVGNILANYGFSEDVIIAGILHDVLEDCDVTEEEIKKEFGDTVLKYVLDVSEKDKSKSWKERKTEHIKRLGTASIESKYIASADHIHNLLSLKEDLDIQGDKIWDKFNASKDNKKWYEEEVLKSLRVNNSNHLIFNEFNKAIRYAYRPKVIELTGTPEAGKTTMLKEIKKHLEGLNKKVIVIEESATKLKTSLSKKSDDRSLWIVLDTMKQFIEAKDQEPDYILVDRGLNDRKFWNEFSYQRGDITLLDKEERDEFINQKHLNYYTDLFVILTCSYETAFERKGSRGKFVNEEWIKIYNSILLEELKVNDMHINTDKKTIEEVKNKILKKII